MRISRSRAAPPCTGTRQRKQGILGRQMHGETRESKSAPRRATRAIAWLWAQDVALERRGGEGGSSWQREAGTSREQRGAPSRRTWGATRTFLPTNPTFQAPLPAAPARWCPTCLAGCRREGCLAGHVMLENVCCGVHPLARCRVRAHSRRCEVCGGGRVRRSGGRQQGGFEAAPGRHKVRPAGGAGTGLGRERGTGGTALAGPGGAAR